MSYRIYVNDNQCLGNNEFPEILRKALNKQGAKIYKSKDYCFHDFEIKELQPIIEALEEYIFENDERLKKRGLRLANYTENFDEWKKCNNFTLALSEAINCGYMFVTYKFLEYIKGDYELDFDRETNKIVYKIKEGHHIYMSGF